MSPEGAAKEARGWADWIRSLTPRELLASLTATCAIVAVMFAAIPPAMYENVRYGAMLVAVWLGTWSVFQVAYSVYDRRVQGRLSEAELTGHLERLTPREWVILLGAVTGNLRLIWLRDDDPAAEALAHKGLLWRGDVPSALDPGTGSPAPHWPHRIPPAIRSYLDLRWEIWYPRAVVEDDQHDSGVGYVNHALEDFAQRQAALNVVRQLADRSGLPERPPALPPRAA